MPLLLPLLEQGIGETEEEEEEEAGVVAAARSSASCVARNDMKCTPHEPRLPRVLPGVPRILAADTGVRVCRQVSPPVVMCSSWHV